MDHARARFIVVITVLIALCVLIPETPLAGAAAPPGLASGWSPPARLYDTRNADGPRVAVDPQGNALAAWSDTDPVTTGGVVMTSFYWVGEGWTPAVRFPIGGGTGSLAYGPSVAANGNGSFVITYAWILGGFLGYEAARVFTRDQGWSEQEWVSPGDAPLAYAGPVAVGPSGEIFAGYLIRYDSGITVGVSRRDVSGSWVQDVGELSGNQSNAYFTGLTFDATGNATIAWVEWNGSIQRAMVSHYSPLGGWSVGVTLSAPTTMVGECAIAADANGTVWALFVGFEASGKPVRGSKFDPRTASWSPAATVAFSAGAYDSGISVVAPAAGKFLAAWSRVYTSDASVVSSRWSTGGAWSSATNLSSAPEEVLDGLSMAAEPFGGARVVWTARPSQTSDRVRVLGAAYNATSLWGPEERIEDTAVGGERFAQLAVDPKGVATVLWETVDFDGSAPFVTRYTPPVPADLTPPALAVTAPLNGSGATAALIDVAGTTEVGATVSVGGWSAAVAPDGSFSAPFPVVPGPNAIEVTARDAAGNARAVTVWVNFDDPLVATRNELQMVAAAAAALQGDLARTTAALAAANATIARMQAELAAAQANLTAAQAQLAAVGTNASLTQAALSALQARLNATDASLAASRLALSDTEAQLASARANETVQDERAATQQAQIDSATAAAGSAAFFGSLGLLFGIIGVGIAAVALVRRRPAREVVSATIEGRPTVDVMAPAAASPTLRGPPSPPTPPAPAALPTAACPRCSAIIPVGAPTCVKCGLSLSWD